MLYSSMHRLIAGICVACMQICHSHRLFYKQTQRAGDIGSVLSESTLCRA